MNNGNLLNSLLGATGAGSAAAKSVTPKSRPDISEKFQQTFDQVRPEVAARKSVVRKEPERTVATEHRQHAAKSDSPPEPAAKRPLEESKKTAAAQQSHESVASESPISAEDEAVCKEINPVADGSVAKEEQLVDITVNETPSLTEPAFLRAASDDILPQVTTAEILPESALTTPTDMEIGLVDKIPAPLLEEEAGLADDTDADDLPDTNPAGDELTDPLLDVAAPLVVSSQPTSLLPEAEAANFGLMNPAINTTPDPKAIPLSAQATPVTGQTGAVKTPEQLLADEADPGFTQSSSGSIPSLTGNETDEAVSFAGNPDFALLSSKAGLNKMVEASFTNMDKAGSATEIVKPTVPASVLEALARSVEPQSPTARTFVVQTGVPVAVGSPQWSQAVGDKVLWLAAQNVSAAEIRLDPPELGPMQVKVSITNDQASVTFTSHNPMVRDALDQQLNRLRDMFSEQGLNLVNVDVSDKSFAQQERDREEANKSRGNVDVDDEELMPVAITQPMSVRLVDHYA